MPSPLVKVDVRRTVRRLTPVFYPLRRESDRDAGSAASRDSPQLFVVAAARLLPRLRHFGQLQGAEPIAATEAQQRRVKFGRRRRRQREAGAAATLVLLRLRRR